MNCVTTTLLALLEVFEVDLDSQVLDAVVGMESEGTFSRQLLRLVTSEQLTRHGIEFAVTFIKSMKG